MNTKNKKPANIKEAGKNDDRYITCNEKKAPRDISNDSEESK